MPYLTSMGQKVRYEDILLPPREALQPVTVEILHSNSQCKMCLETTQQLNLANCTGFAHKLNIECTVCATSTPVH